MIVQTENLSKWYGEVMGVNDISLTIHPGITGLLGPNGAGKTTLIKLMTACLLYTSPSPRDRTRSRMPSSA